MKIATKHRGSGRSRHAGFSMVELMIAVAIGLIVLVAVSYAYLSNRMTYLVNVEMARMGQSARVTLDAMRSSLRMAGSIGCYRPDGRLEVLDSSDNALTAFADGVNDRNNAARVQVDPNGRLLIYSAASQGLAQINGGESSAGDLYVQGGITAHKLELHAIGSGNENGTPIRPFMVVSDCEKAVAFKVSKVDIPESGTGVITATGGNFEDKNAVFARGAQVFGVLSASDGVGTEFAGEIFELKKTDPVRNDLRGNPIFSLFYNGVELAEGVEAFKVCGTYKDDDKVTYGLGGSKLNYDSYELEPIPADGNSPDASKLQQIQVDLVMGSIPPRLLAEPTRPEITLCGDESNLILPDPERDAKGLTYRIRRLFTASVQVRGNTELQKDDNSENAQP